MKLLEGLVADPADAFKIGASYVIGSLVTGFCLVTAWVFGDAKYLQVLLCILGGSIGWIAGLYLTLQSESEKRKFSEFAKAIAAFVSGFGLAKVESLIDWAQNSAQGADAQTIAVRSLLFACPLLIGVHITYFSRLHVRGTKADLESKREEEIAQIESSLAKLRALK